MREEFRPYILAFCCNWCAYAGADLAGTSRMQYAPTVRIIRVMCSGRVNPVFILEALKQGVDGVAILACHPGDCHYMTGNFKAERRIHLLKKLISEFGIDSRRVKFDFVSAAEGKRFAEMINNFTEELKKLGPNPLRELNAPAELEP